MDINDALDLFSQYLLAEKGLSNQTLSSYLDDLKQFFLYFNNKKDTNDLIGEDLIEFFRYQQSVGKSISTSLRRLSSTKSFYYFLKREGIINIDIPKIEPAKRPQHLPNCLSIEEDKTKLIINEINRELDKPLLKRASEVEKKDGHK